MSHLDARISDYFPADDTMHCNVCERDDMTGVEISFDSGFIKNIKMCISCLEQVLEFKDRMTDPKYKQDNKGH